MIGFLFMIFIVGLILYIKFKPNLSYIESCKRLILWYNIPDKYNNDYHRDFIVLYEG